MDTTNIAIIGAGPYGLALAAHLRDCGMSDVRIFGDPMGSWKYNMPAGMLLKSMPWASNIADPDRQLTIAKFYRDRGMPYDDSEIAIPRETFVEYGEDFQRRRVPDVERKMVTRLELLHRQFVLHLEDGDRIAARRVVLAVGMTPFKLLPDMALGLPPEFVSHGGDYGPIDGLRGKRVIVVGAGSTATDLAALLHEAGIDVGLVARTPELKFGEIKPRPLAARIAAPDSGIGWGWPFMVCAYAPWAVHPLPDTVRLRLAYTQSLGPLGGAFMRERVIGRFPLLLGRALIGVRVRHDKVCLDLYRVEGRERIDADHVIFATGYKVDVNKIPFLDGNIAAQMKLIGGAPRLRSYYESSVPDLYFIGPATAPSFGPVCRFVHGTGHPARYLARRWQRDASHA